MYCHTEPHTGQLLEYRCGHTRAREVVANADVDDVVIVIAPLQLRFRRENRFLRTARPQNVRNDTTLAARSIDVVRHAR